MRSRTKCGRTQANDRRPDPAHSSQRKDDNLIQPFVVRAAFGEQDQINDDGADGGLLRHRRHASMMPAIADTLPRKLDQCRDVVSQHQAPLCRCPLEDSFIGCSAHADILDAWRIDVGYASPKAAQQVVIEIFVREQPNQAPLTR